MDIRETERRDMDIFTSFYFVYWTKQSIAQTTACKYRIISEELFGKTYYGTAMNCKQYPGICLAELSKTTNNPIQNTEGNGKD